MKNIEAVAQGSAASVSLLASGSVPARRMYEL